MSKRNYYFLGLVVVALAACALFIPSYGYRLRNWLSPLASGPLDAANLAAQNQQLQAQLAKLQTVASQLPNSGSGAGVATSTLPAMVYSRYPLNFKNELLIDAGAGQGILPGKAVLFHGILIGTIDKVFTDGATVRTVFDPNFRIPVRIGASGGVNASGIDALFQGGAEPAIVSISKSAAIKTGDIIYSAAPGMRYALPIGSVGDVSISSNNLFQQATVNFAYDVNSVQTVEVQK